ncbi:MAG: DUF3460 family protein [Burkholderiales bacterium]
MSFFRRADYQSDVTQFIERLKAERPGLEASQRAGRALLWDKNVDLDGLRIARRDQVPQKPYVYQSDVTPKPAVDVPLGPKG